MPTAYGSGTLKQIQHLLDEGTFTGLSDARLLERFVTRRDEAAFAALVERHGAMVRNTCRAVLKDPNAADDAFQATFVLLFRKGRDARFPQRGSERPGRHHAPNAGEGREACVRTSLVLSSCRLGFSLTSFRVLSG